MDTSKPRKTNSAEVIAARELLKRAIAGGQWPAPVTATMIDQLDDADVFALVADPKFKASGANT
jgi:hypothetical protein